ncbi:MAG: hypothetical protein ACRDEA_21355, partial [Microcystaceae cyanobacterium]
MKLVKHPLKKILGPKRYYEWLTVTRVRLGILWSGPLNIREFREYTNELSSSGFLRKMFTRRREFLEAKKGFGRESAFGGM